MGKGFGKSNKKKKKPKKKSSKKLKPSKLQQQFLDLMWIDSRKAAELLVKHDLDLPIREETDIDWSSVDAVEQWINEQIPEIKRVVSKAERELRFK